VAFTRVLLDRLGCDPDSRSISIVDCGGRENLRDYIHLLDELHIGLLVGRLARRERPQAGCDVPHAR
jgi:hypothetical protein